jgi:hypothetical protein
LSRIADVLDLPKKSLFRRWRRRRVHFWVLRATQRRGKSRIKRGSSAGNEALLARHQVKPRELKVLSQVNLLGKITAPRQFVFILNAIRQAVEEEETPLG